MEVVPVSATGQDLDTLITPSPYTPTLLSTASSDANVEGITSSYKPSKGMATSSTGSGSKTKTKSRKRETNEKKKQKSEEETETNM